MTTVADKLATLNSLRAVNGKPALKSWKNSIAELDQRIQDEMPSTAVYTPVPDTTADVQHQMAEAVKNTTVEPTILPPAPELATQAKRADKINKLAAKAVAKDEPTTVIDLKAKIKVPARKKTADTAPKNKAKAPAKSTNEFGALLQELGLDPKKARAKLRSHDLAAPYTDLKRIRAILTTDARKKKAK